MLHKMFHKSSTSKVPRQKVFHVNLCLYAGEVWLCVTHQAFTPQVMFARY